MLLSLLMGNWRILATMLVLAAALCHIDNRAYHSGLDKAERVCEDETVPAAIAVEQASCLQQITRLEKSNAENLRSKNDANARYAAAMRQLRINQTAKRDEISGAGLAESGASGLQVSGEGGEDILALGRDAQIRSDEFLNCRSVVLNIQ